jgi:hypothetical protein
MPTISMVLCGLYRWEVSVIIKGGLEAANLPPHQLFSNVPWRGFLGEMSQWLPGLIPPSGEICFPC